MRTLTTILTAFALVAFLAAPTNAQNPYTQADNTWISISGEVESVLPGSFELDYGDGTVTVEMDDGDRDADAYKLLSGDEVTVAGMVDDDLFETTTIEASSVYVEKLGTYFYASAVDEEDAFVTVYAPLAFTSGMLQGTVTKVDDEEFLLDTGLREITVEVEEMTYNPLDDEGYQKIQKGDVVSVTGEIDYDLFEGREFVAKTVTTLIDTSAGSSASSR